MPTGCVVSFTHRTFRPRKFMLNTGSPLPGAASSRWGTACPWSQRTEGLRPSLVPGLGGQCEATEIDRALMCHSRATSQSRPISRPWRPAASRKHEPALVRIREAAPPFNPPTYLQQRGGIIVLKQRPHVSHRTFIGLGPLTGNAIWSGIAWVAVLLHVYGFLAAIVVFKILNELTVIQQQQGLD